MTKRFCSNFILSLIVFSNLSLAKEISGNATTPVAPITFYTESYPPANYMENDELVGITVESLKLMWAEQGINEQDIQLVPWSRGYRNVLQTSNSALFTMSKTPAREHLFKWVGPIFNSMHVLVAKKSAQLKFENFGEIIGHSVVTLKGEVSEIILKQVGFQDFNMAKASSMERAFRMLESDRVEMMMTSVHGFQHIVELLKIDQSKYQQVWQIEKIGNYIAFNINTPDSVIQSYQQAFDNLAMQRKLIKQKYHLPKIEY
ncbi:ABC transporter substrate-binding protein [uncultured Paraglaciecola sp.]|uniref:substrate-binding periplasmic protein n=1 Tax=uncultured Paraglaciecola sp. TaxID=1765024 RepID=UPI002618E947|nr:transporter substrate-binding domain-containing protein [uncultured Paraglaciecola sp.]